VRRDHAVLVSKRMWIVALGLLAVPLLVGFNARLARSRELFEEEARLQNQLDEQRTLREFLEQYEAYARSEAYVEQAARRLGMARPGEGAVRSLTPADLSSEVQAPAVVAVPRDYVFEWWSALFAGMP